MSYIDEYLVKLGADIKTSDFQKMQNTLNKASSQITKATEGWAKDFSKAAAAVSAAYTAIASSIAALTINIAKKDLEMEKFARNMMISKQAAWEMKNAVDALGHSIRDIQMTPELREQYKALVMDARRMMPGADFNNQAKNVRSLMFEFTRLKQEATYALTWIGYHIMKNLEGPIRNLRQQFKAINENIINNMPELTAKVSGAFMYIVNIGKNLFRFFKDVGKAVYDMWDSFPSGLKKAIAAFGAVFAVIKMSSFGRFIMLIQAAILLIDDFYGHLNGKEAAFGKFWDKLIVFGDKAKESIDSVIQAIGNLFSDIDSNKELEEFSDIAEDIWDSLTGIAGVIVREVSSAFAFLFKELKEQKVMQQFLETCKSIGKAIAEIIGLVKDVYVLLEKDTALRKFREVFISVLTSIVSKTLKLIEGLSTIVRFIVKAVREGISGLSDFSFFPTANAAGSGIGALSAKHESTDSKSHGNDSTGGHSYGRYQIAAGTMGEFLDYLDTANPEYGRQLRSARQQYGVGNTGFSNVWDSLVDQDPELFYQLEHGFIDQTHYQPQIAALQNMGLDVNNRSETLRKVVWSMAVQMRDYTPDIFRDALNGRDPNTITDEELIPLLYQHRGNYFSQSTSEERASVRNRFVNESADALALLAVERQNNPNPQNHSTPNTPSKWSYFDPGGDTYRALENMPVVNTNQTNSFVFHINSTDPKEAGNQVALRLSDFGFVSKYRSLSGVTG